MKRRSRLNFSFAPERIERLKATPEFQEIAASDKEPGKERDKEIRYRQERPGGHPAPAQRHGREAGLPRPGRVPQAA